MSTTALDPMLGVPPLVRPVRWFRPWLLAFFYWLVLIPLTFFPKHSANVLSRFMTIEAIVERGTLAIEQTPMMKIARPADVVRFRNHYYSDKPPVLAAIASPVYMSLVLARVRFTGSEAQFFIDNLVLTWVVAGTCSALTLVWLRQMFQAIPIAPTIADLLTLGFGFGSLLFCYAVTFNNHSVAAGLITGAMACTLLERPGKRLARRRFLAGFLAALAGTIDLPAGLVMLAGLGIVLTLRCRSIPWSFVAGTIGPLALHAWLQSLVTGTPLPVEMYPKAFEYPGSFWLKPENVWHEHGPRWRFGLELLVGPQGWLTITPVLAFGLAGLVLAVSTRRDPLRPMAFVVLGSVMVMLGYYTWGVRRTDFGGQSFGIRHLLAITPDCFFFAVAALDRLRGKIVAGLFVVAMGIGILYAVGGVQHPWMPIQERVVKDPWLKPLQTLVIYPRNQNLEKPGVER